MGLDMTTYVEVKREGKWVLIEDKIFTDAPDKSNSPFNWRSYAMYGFLGNMRNDSNSEYLSYCRGLPEDSEYLNSPHKHAYTFNPFSGEDIPLSMQETNKSWLYDIGHGHSFVYLKELLDFDYSKKFEDLRGDETIYDSREKVIGYNGCVIVEPGYGEIKSYTDFLPETFFTNIQELRTLGVPEDVRVFFYFD